VCQEVGDRLVSDSSLLHFVMGQHHVAVMHGLHKWIMFACILLQRWSVQHKEPILYFVNL